MGSRDCCSEELAFNKNAACFQSLPVSSRNRQAVRRDEELVLKSPETKYPMSWSHDGRFLLPRKAVIASATASYSVDAVTLTVWSIPSRSRTVTRQERADIRRWHLRKRFVRFAFSGPVGDFRN